jgi:hypothetical protein
MKEKYIEECKIIQQNCTYTAEAHHHLAIWNRGLAYAFQIIPAVIATVTSVLVVANAEPRSWLWATVIASAISAVTTVLDPNKKYLDHLNAAKNFTVIKHDARFLCEAKSHNMGDEAFRIAVENLHEKYNDLIKMTPPTGAISFWRARKIIGAGIHEPDTDPNGKIK